VKVFPDKIILTLHLLLKGEFVYFDHGYLEEEKSMIHSFRVTFGAKYLTGMVISVLHYEIFSLIKNNILHH
jgi:hypothetical protein